MELWGGVECTVNRIGERWSDQLCATGHHDRFDDMEALTSLGLGAVRYPILWERVSPTRPDERSWEWSDARLDVLRGSGTQVIAGLVHHGSGPHYTDLLSDNFSAGVAAHARAVAERYPWIEAWTPINEPVTTARFSALYGIWYPHARDELAFWRALLNQIDATRKAMRAVRAINPAAKLVQPDDLGRTYATAPLRDQAAFDNSRRWMGWDLLCGRVTGEHPMFERLSRLGLQDRLRAILDDPCPPSVIGINHYLTSDRFLDHRCALYPGEQYAGNGRQRYVDVEAIRALSPAPEGLNGALRAAWDRYHLPVAVTEVHNGCTREEQLRWMLQAWRTAQQCVRDGVDVRAVTTWALFGSRGWNTLLRSDGPYEAGAFDSSGAKARPTALARLIQTLQSETQAPPLAEDPGWWQQPIRVTRPFVPRAAPVFQHVSPSQPRARRPILICGGTGTLGRALAQACHSRSLAHIATARSDLALDDEDSIARALDHYRPWAVINAAGWVNVDEAEADREACAAVNDRGAKALARASATRAISHLLVSSDLVFSGRTSRCYIEDDVPSPLNVYGNTKYAAENEVLALSGTHLVVRTAAFFSPHDPYNFAAAVVATLREKQRFRAAHDEFVTPTYVPHLVTAILDLIIDGETGIWHLTNNEALTWADFAVRVATACGFDPTLIEAVPGQALCRPAARPRFSGLASSRGGLLPSLSDAIAAFASSAR